MRYGWRNEQFDNKLGLQYLAGDIIGGNARCIAMLQAFQRAFQDYSTPSEKTINRDLIAKINSYVSFLIECRPLSISMGNAIRFLKARVTELPLDIPESEAKASICSDINRFIYEKIVLADRFIVRHAVTKIRDGDVLLTYGSSSVVEMILLHAQELGTLFRVVVVVYSRTKLEGQALVRRLVQNGVSCTNTRINAVSLSLISCMRSPEFFWGLRPYSLMEQYTRGLVLHVLLWLLMHSVFQSWYAVKRINFMRGYPQLDSICSNELDPTHKSSCNYTRVWGIIPFHVNFSI